MLDPEQHLLQNLGLADCFTSTIIHDFQKNPLKFIGLQVRSFFLSNFQYSIIFTCEEQSKFTYTDQKKNKRYPSGEGVLLYVEYTSGS